MSLDIHLKYLRPVDVFHNNITHNLGEMAKEAGLYLVMWHPEDIKVTKAKQAVPYLKEGIKNLRLNPDKYKKFNPVNGWGSYEGLLSSAEEYLSACVENPNSIIEVCR